MEKLKQLVPSPRVRVILWCAGAVILASLIFHAGVAVGSHRHLRSGAGEWGFRGPGFVLGLPHEFMHPGHGTVGIIEKISTSSLMIATRDGDSDTVLLSGATIVRRDAGDASSTVLQIGEHVIVLGAPTHILDSDDAINATFIRVIREATTGTTTSK